MRSTTPAKPSSDPRSSKDEPHRYVDWQLIGEGGSAKVYRVRDLELGIPLAIKILDEKLAKNERQRAFLRNEVLISRALRHNFICPIHDLYQGPEGVGIVMDLLSGCDLREWMNAHLDDLHQTHFARFDVLCKLADALNIAHERIVHCDLKPSNIFLIDRDIARPMILDFGISVFDAKEAVKAAGGTPRYMAPEQFRGNADARSDLFSLGVIAYQLLSGGIHPLEASGIARVTADTWQSAKIPSLNRYNPLVGRTLDRIVLQLMAAEPERRPATAGALLVALRSARAEAANDDNARESQAAQSWVSVPAGTYTVGSGSDSRFGQEKPMREVSLSAYKILTTPVTNEDYSAYVRATGTLPPPLFGHPEFGQPNHPVVMITWEEAAAYAAWLGGSLPTEFQWEAAAKAGEPHLEYPWGSSEPTSQHANFDQLVGTTTPVGSYGLGRNAWKLIDMAGNVNEWCADAYHDRAYRQIANGAVDPVTVDPDTNDRVIRGGGFDDFESALRCAFRGKAAKESRRPDIGFRVVLADE